MTDNDKALVAVGYLKAPPDHGRDCAPQVEAQVGAIRGVAVARHSSAGEPDFDELVCVRSRAADGACALCL